MFENKYIYLKIYSHRERTMCPLLRVIGLSVIRAVEQVGFFAAAVRANGSSRHPLSSWIHLHQLLDISWEVRAVRMVHTSSAAITATRCKPALPVVFTAVHVLRKAACRKSVPQLWLLASASMPRNAATALILECLKIF